VSEYLKILLPFFAGSIVLLVVIRVVASRLKRRALDEIRRKFAGRTIVRQSVGANYFGRSSAGLGQVRGNGVLVLTADELYFLMFAPHRELTIPLNTVTSVSTPRSHLGKTAGVRLLRVDFRAGTGEDTAAWAVRGVDEWLADLRRYQPAWAGRGDG
jgi:hypothetical protein